MKRSRTEIENLVLNIRQGNENISQFQAVTTSTVESLTLEVLLDIREMLEPKLDNINIPPENILKTNIINLVIDHKQNCHNQNCTISLYFVKVLAEMAGMTFSDEEVMAFV